MCIGSCLGSCCATCGCEAMKACCPSVKSASRLPYLLVMFCSTFVAIMLRFYGAPVVVNLYVTEVGFCTSDRCLGFGAVYRISFALFAWFLMLGCAMLSESCAAVDRGYWFPKILLYCFLFVLTWMIPNEFYEVYVHFAQVISGIFLFLQILILIDFAISWNKEWTKEGNESMRPWALVCALLMYAASLVMIIMMFLWFGGAGCDLENFVLSFTIITTLAFTLLALSPAAEGRGGILPAAVMALYIHYVAYSALASDPDSCNTLRSTGTVQLVIGLILACLSISYAAWNLATSSSLFGDEKAPEDEPLSASAPASSYAGAASGSGASDSAAVVINSSSDEQKEIALAKDNKAAASGDLGTGKMPTAAAAEKADGDAVATTPAKTDVEKADAAQAKADAKADEEEDRPVPANQSARFHFIMAAAAMYMAMILTNWSTFKVGLPSENEQLSDFGAEAMWIKIVSQWITALLYIWWLLAPIICKNRDFSEDS